jgi:hypothetical protein
MDQSQEITGLTQLCACEEEESPYGYPVDRYLYYLQGWPKGPGPDLNKRSLVTASGDINQSSAIALRDTGNPGLT